MSRIVETAGLTVVIEERSGGEEVALQGELDTASVGAFTAALNLAGAALPSRLVVEASGLRFIASCGVRAIASAARGMQAYGDLQVSGATDEVRRVFELTGNGSLLAPRT